MARENMNVAHNSSSSSGSSTSSSSTSSNESLEDEYERKPLVVQQRQNHRFLFSKRTWKRRVSLLMVIAVGLLLIWLFDWSPSLEASTDVLLNSSVPKANHTTSTSATTSVSTSTSSSGSLGIPGYRDGNYDSSLVSSRESIFSSPLASPTTKVEKEAESSSAAAAAALRGVALLKCPDHLPTPFAATDTRHHKEWYETESSRLIASNNVSEYLTVFRECEFDNWGHTYNVVKKEMYEWKAKHFLELVSSDDDDSSNDGNNNNNGSRIKTIYESACGIGLNLYMTLEILVESLEKSSLLADHHNIVVYGNEYQADSTRIAREIATHQSFPGVLGSICQGDSTNLSFVPSNTFDLVYTGYISPLSDPLRLADEFHIDSDEDLYGRYTDYCESNDTRTADHAQQIQEEWYAQWVGEMIRIAKPGAKVIVEQISYPLCRALYDWGGVSRNSWKRAIKKYNWEVDPKSIEYQDDTIFRHRYHMAMRKLKKKKKDHDDGD